MAETVKSPRTHWTQSSSNWFACILYPDEDSNHKAFLSYMEKNNIIYPKFIYIYHYKDVITQDYLDDWISDEKNNGKIPPSLGDLKKPHIHFLFKRKNRCPASTVQNYFRCWIHHVEAVRDFDCYAQYMLHNDPESISLGKPSYNPSEFRGDPELCQEAIVQNAKSVLFDNLLDIIKDMSGGTLLDLYEILRKDYPEFFNAYKAVIKDNAYVVNSLCRSREKRLEAEFESRMFSALVDGSTNEELKKLFWKGKRFRQTLELNYFKIGIYMVSIIFRIFLMFSGVVNTFSIFSLIKY